MIIFNSAFIFAKKKFVIDKIFIKYLLLGVLVIIFYFNVDLNYTNENIIFFNIYNEDLFVLDLIKENLKFNSYFLYDVFNLFNFIIIFILLFSLFGNYKILLEKYSSLIPLLFSFFIIILISFFSLCTRSFYYNSNAATFNFIYFIFLLCSNLRVFFKNKKL